MNRVASPLARRTVLAAAGVASAAVAVSGWASPAAAGPGRPPARPAEPRWRGARSENGWSIRPSDSAFPVQGSNLVVRLREGAPATVLLHCLRRYFYEIDDTLRAVDLHGHRSDRAVAHPLASNFLSGTAVAIRPGWYPVGGAERMWPRDVVVLRDILAECEGVVAWGGDADPAVQSYLGIAVPPGDAGLARVAARIGRWQRRPDVGAGTLVDPFDPARRRRARALPDPFTRPFSRPRSQPSTDNERN